jgi:hypothetical protein
MKTKFILIITIVQYCFVSLQAQIGVNTENPIGIFHIDPKRNTPANATGASASTIDDIVIDAQGNLGIGTVSPKAKLHIVTGGTVTTPVTGVRIVDGNQANNRLLTTDANGYTSWQDVPSIPTAIATKVGANIPSNVTTFYNTNSYITLPPGRWKVTTTTLISTGTRNTTVHDKIWAHSFFSESTAAIQTAANMSPDVESGKQMASLLTKYAYNVMVGNTVINNQTNGPKKYYYLIGGFGQVGNSVGNVTFNNVAGTQNAENSIIGVLIQD